MRAAVATIIKHVISSLCVDCPCQKRVHSSVPTLPRMSSKLLCFVLFCLYAFIKPCPLYAFVKSRPSRHLSQAAEMQYATQSQHVYIYIYIAHRSHLLVSLTCRQAMSSLRGISSSVVRGCSGISKGRGHRHSSSASFTRWVVASVYVGYSSRQGGRASIEGICASSRLGGLKYYASSLTTFCIGVQPPCALDYIHGEGS